jgi:hypothetical protein
MFFTAIHFTSGQQTDKPEKRLRISPLPVIYYSPETRFGFGALLAANFETGEKSDTITRSSYFQTYFLYTVNKQYDWGTITRVYSPQNRFIFNGKFNYTYFPEYYFGMETEEPESHKDTIEYNRIAADLRFFWRVNSKNFYAGIAPRFVHTANVESGFGTFQNEKPLGYTGYWVMGIAPAITIETRDNFVYPRKGFYLEALYYLYPSWSGSSYSFQSFKLDVRKYFPLKLISDIDVVAFQFLANVNTGDVPFKDMADIGGSYTMRGYYTGYYRYKNLYALQAEFRGRIWKRLGFTTWIGAALTPTEWYTFFDHPVKPNAGVGLRVMLNTKDKLNIRLDQGFGKNQNGFYLDVAEAF